MNPLKLNNHDWILANAQKSRTIGEKHNAMDLCGSASLLQAEAPAADGKAKPRRFEMTAYNGGPMNVGWSFPVVVDLAGMDIGNSARPILIDHTNDLEYLLGQTDQITKSTNSLKVTGKIHAQSETAKQVVALADDGFQFQASVGVRVINREIVPAGQTATANGREHEGPVIIARKSVLGEVSFVTLGADDSTSARIAAQAAKGNAMTFEQWLIARGFKLADLDETQKASLQAMYNSEITAGGIKKPEQKDNPGANPQDDPVTAIRASSAAEFKRVTTIRAMAATYPGHDDMVAKAIEDGSSPEQAEATILKAALPKLKTGGGSSRPQINGMLVAAAVALSAGISMKTVEASIPTAEREKVMNEAVSANWRGYGVHCLMDAVIAQSGGYFGGSRKSDSFIRAAFEAEQQLKASGFTSFSLTGILGNVANKKLIDSYNSVETTWNKICGIRSHSDFKAVTRYRLDITGSFKKIGKAGDLKHVGFGEGSYSNQLDTFGAIVALTRQDMINDDLGAFLQIADLLGRLAGIRIEEAVYVLLLSNPGSFFHANNRNLMTGGASALSIDSLTTAESKFKNQIDSNKKPILTTPKILLTGTTLDVTARNIFAEKLLITGENATKTANNPHAGKYTPVSSPYLNNTAIRDQDGKAITGQSDTLWCLLADPAVRAAVVIAFLNGQQVPTVESGQTDFGTLGMQWRGFHDFGVGMEDPVAAVESAGA